MANLSKPSLYPGDGPNGPLLSEVRRTPLYPRREGAKLKLPTAYFWLLAPALVFVVGFAAYPLFRTVYLGFTDLNAGGQANWIGFDNYVAMFEDNLFWDSVVVTLVFVVVGVTVELVLAWALALLLARSVSRAGGFLRTLFVIPMMLSPVVIGITWRMLLNPQFGWVNALLSIPGTDWLGDPGRAIWVLIAVDVWQWTPFIFLMILAGLLSVPEEVREAARLDGAGSFRIFRHITFPLLLPVTLVAVLLRTVDATKTFELPFNLTSGGPGNTTTTIAIYMYRRAFGEFEQGYASALAVVVTLALILFALVYFWAMRRIERKVL